MFPVTGHEKEVAYLRRGLAEDRLSHAYLITGPAHVGKMAIALALAQAVNCTGQEKPCGECEACRRIASLAHPDVQVVRLLGAAEAEDKKAKSEVVIGQVRDLQHWASLPPFEGRKRVFIFEQAELLNQEAANCLLKTLEEPLPHVLFLLLTPSPELLPETVVSRCQRLDLRPLPAEKVEEMLVGRGIACERARLLARLSHGAPGWALLAVEDESLLAARQERLKTMVGLVQQGYEERFEFAGELTASTTKARAETGQALALWQELWRDLLLLRAGLPEAITNLDLRGELDALSGRLDLAAIKSFLVSLAGAEAMLARNVNTRLLLEVLLLDMPRVNSVPLKSQPRA